MPDLLALERVTAGYGETTVLEAISFTMPQAASWAVLGRNGVGKTTLLATMMGVTTHLSGTIHLDGHDLTPIEPHERARRGLGFVPQEREIFPSLTVDENLRVAARPGDWTRERVYDLFPRLAERRRNYGNQLSGGEQQMLAVARALVGNPRIVLLDEPFEGLAPVIVDALVDALAKLRRESGMAFLITEQQVEIALELTDEAIVLDHGTIVWQGASRVLAADANQLAALIGLQDTSN